jgi:hypothetical protein
LFIVLMSRSLMFLKRVTPLKIKTKTFNFFALLLFLVSLLLLWLLFLLIKMNSQSCDGQC